MHRSALTYAWIGPFVGAAVRPVGADLDKVGGSIVTQLISVVMVFASGAVGCHDASLWLGHA